MAIAMIAGNVIQVNASRVHTFRVLVHPHLVRLDQPLRIVVDGETVFEELVRPDPGYVLASFLENRDRRLLYVAEVRVILGDR
jgi:hypothetical protein